MIKVLQILSGFNRGGMETFIMNVYRVIDKSKVQFDFLLGHQGGDYEQEALSLGANIYYMGSRRDGIFEYCNKLDAFFKEHANEYRAVHYHESTLTSLEPLYFAKKYNIQVRVLHSHSSSVSGSKLHYFSHWVNKLFVKKIATHYLGCSEKANHWFYKYTGEYSHSEMIPNGIIAKNYIFNDNCRLQIRKSLNINPDTLVIAHIGRFIWIKNHKYLLEVFDKLHKLNNNSKLLLIGVGELVEDIKQLVNNKHLENDVMFLGLRTDVPLLLNAIDIVLMPSFYEGLPVSLVEAQASGTFVLGSDTISHDTAITDYMKFKSIKDDPQHWADYIMNTLPKYPKKNMINEIKSAGFDISATANRLIDIYNS